WWSRFLLCRHHKHLAAGGTLNLRAGARLIHRQFLPTRRVRASKNYIHRPYELKWKSAAKLIFMPLVCQQKIPSMPEWTERLRSLNPGNRTGGAPPPRVVAGRALASSLSASRAGEVCGHL